MPSTCVVSARDWVWLFPSQTDGEVAKIIIERLGHQSGTLDADAWECMLPRYEDYSRLSRSENDLRVE